MRSPEVPLHGRTLVVGPSNAGKTRLTAAALEAWVHERGPDETVVLDFAPELEREGGLLGGRLSRFVDVPRETWYGVLEAHAPRAEGRTVDEAVALASDNAARAARLFTEAPDAPRAVFVNDATIPFQHEAGDVEALLRYCEPAECVVCNAFASDELGIDDPVSAHERAALDRLTKWADCVVELGDY